MISAQTAATLREVLLDVAPRIAANPADLARTIGWQLGARERGEELGGDEATLRFVSALALLATDAVDKSLSHAEALFDSAVFGIHARAVALLANARRAEVGREAPWPPLVLLGATPLAEAWLSLVIGFERGEPAAALQSLITRIDATADCSDDTGLADAIAEVVAILRGVSEQAGAGTCARMAAAAACYRLRRFSESIERYSRIADAIRDTHPYVAERANSAADMIRSLTGDFTPTPERRSGWLAVSLREEAQRSNALASCYKVIAKNARPQKDGEHDDAIRRLANLGFADRLAGDLRDALWEMNDAGAVLLAGGRLPEGFDFLLDGLQTSEVSKAVKDLASQSFAEATYRDVLAIWRKRRSIVGAEGVFAALADWLTPSLDPERDAEVFDSLAALAEHGDATFAGNLDIGRAAGRALGRVATAAAGARGKDSAETLLRIACDQGRLFPYRVECVEALGRYLNTWFEDSDIDVAWLEEFAMRLADGIAGAPEHLGAEASFVLGRYLYAIERLRGPSARLRSAFERLVDVSYPATGSDERERRLWVEVVFGVGHGGALSDDVVYRFVEIVRAQIATARRGRPRSGLGVALGMYDPVVALGAILRRGNAVQQAAAESVLFDYANESFLSDAHRVVALEALSRAVGDLDQGSASLRERCAELASKLVAEPLYVDPHPFRRREGTLQVEAIVLLAACEGAATEPQVIQAATVGLELRTALEGSDVGSLLAALGSMCRRLPVLTRERVMGWIVRETVSDDTRRLVGAWSAIVRALDPADASSELELTTLLLDALRDSQTTFVSRRTIVAGLANRVRDDSRLVPIEVLDEVVAIATDDFFWPVRIHGERLRKHLVARSSGAPST